MKEKLQGLYVFLVLFAWLFQIDVSAQKNEQLLLRKKEAINSSNVSGAVLEEINTARQNPQQHITYLEDYRRQFNGLHVSDSNGKFIMTVEGMQQLMKQLPFSEILRRSNRCK